MPVTDPVSAGPRTPKRRARSRRFSVSPATRRNQRPFQYRISHSPLPHSSIRDVSTGQPVAVVESAEDMVARAAR
eukprot:1632611-Rhodomonas_salina.3